MTFFITVLPSDSNGYENYDPERKSLRLLFR
jgi:hypothetical protein